ncbi:hypothetical protein K8O68_13580 [Salipaludibacillus sp. CUR1]|uniref:hypothetical protein n=1 Tax=Salipaludibacillus sp. CUR1 TaxID=2820003 RepID=UPI001E2EEFA1|nr:hypothetical protein [Salipaludibacillus sp. CUR1]MCE7793451.1 hypothetical protein [Salipaludibacillus sp. CUR1]
MAQKKEELLQEVLEDFQPNSPEEHAQAFGYLKGLDSSITQAKYSKAIGISDRGLRKYLSDHKETYEEEIERGKEEAEPEIDLNSMQSRQLSEEQIDEFIKSLYESAIQGSARDKQLLIDFTGMTANDVMVFQNTKASSLRWFIKNSLSSINKHMDTRQLGIMLEESDKLYRGNKKSAGNTQNFIDADISDESFKQELMYFGLLFASLYNQTEHPDLELLAQAVRTERAKNKASQLLGNSASNKNVKKYALGKDWDKQKQSKTSPEEWEQFFIHDLGYSKQEAKEKIEVMQQAKSATKAPDVDKEQVRLRESQYEDELEVFVDTQEELQSMIRKSERQNRKKNNKQKGEGQ